MSKLSRVCELFHQLLFYPKPEELAILGDNYREFLAHKIATNFFTSNGKSTGYFVRKHYTVVETLMKTKKTTEEMWRFLKDSNIKELALIGRDFYHSREAEEYP